MSHRPTTTIALTGSTGFLGTHIALQLIKRGGFNVHACVRGGADSPKLDFLKKYVHDSNQQHQNKNQPTTIKFFDADLTSPNASEQFQRAFDGCDHVIHTAAVALAHARVKNPQKEIIEPSVKGMENIIDACSKISSSSSSNVLKRLIFTSSQVTLWDVTKQPDFDPITQKPLTYTEKDFNSFVTSRPNCGGDFYGYAKTVAERMVLDASSKNKISDTNNNFPHAVSLLPTAILGSCFMKSHSKASPVWIRNILQCNKQLDFRCGWVDVESCAFAHIQACLVDLTKKKNDDEKDEKEENLLHNRFILNATDCKLSDLAPMIQKMYPQYKAEFHNLDQDLLEKLCQESEYLRLHSQQTRYLMDSSLSREVLGVEYPPLEETLKKTVDSLVSSGYVKPVLK